MMDFMRLSLRKAARVVVATDALGVIAVFQAQIGLDDRFPRGFRVRLFGGASQVVGDFAESLL